MFPSRKRGANFSFRQLTHVSMALSPFQFNLTLAKSRAILYPNSGQKCIQLPPPFTLKITSNMCTSNSFKARQTRTTGSPDPPLTRPSEPPPRMTRTPRIVTTATRAAAEAACTTPTSPWSPSILSGQSAGGTRGTRRSSSTPRCPARDTWDGKIQGFCGAPKMQNF